MDNVNQNCTSVSEFATEDLTKYFVVKISILLTYAVIFVIGLLGNFGVLIKVLRHQRHRSPQNFFLLNLIVTDILLCLAAIPTTPLYGLTRNWNYGIIVCRSVNFINSLAVFVSSWCLASIALDKYLHIIKPTRATMGYKSGAVITLVIWAACSLINVPFVMSYQIIDGASMNFSTPLCETFCEEVNWGIIFPRRLYGAAVVILQFVAPLIIISFCYARILRKVSSDMIIKNEKYSDCLTAEQRLYALSRKNRVYYILISMVVTFVASWTPLTLVNAAKDFQFDGDFLNSQPYFIPICAHVFAMTSIIINPLLFFWLTRRVQKSKLSRISSFGFNSIMSRVSFLCRYTSVRNFEKPFRDDDDGNEEEEEEEEEVEEEEDGDDEDAGSTVDGCFRSLQRTEKCGGKQCSHSLLMVETQSSSIKGHSVCPHQLNTYL